MALTQASASVAHAEPDRAMPHGFACERFHAMGTACRIEYRADSPSTGESFKTMALAWLISFEARYSRYKPDSMISAINCAAGEAWVEIDEELEGILALCDWFHWVTRGVFDPTSLPLVKLWDYKADTPRIPSDEEIDATRALVGWCRVEREPGRIRLPRPGMAIDLGGIGKEYAVDRVVEMARAFGIRDLLVDFGSDIRTLGTPPEGGAWRIGLEMPSDPGRCWGGVLLDDRAVATSGDYRRAFTSSGKRYGHILDPRTGRPVLNGCRAASVVAPTCTEAGIYATAAVVLGLEAGLDLIDSACQLAGAVWTDDMGVRSRRFADYEITSF